MKWYEQFKVGQEVKVIKKVLCWKLSDGGGCSWNEHFMDETIGKVYKIIEIKKYVGYKLSTQINRNKFGDRHNMDFWYPVEALVLFKVKGQQLLFNFMDEG